MSRNVKLRAVAAVSLMLSGIIVPTTSALADTVNKTNNTIATTNDKKSFTVLYQDLAFEKKIEFAELVKSENLSSTTQYQLLLDRYNISREATPRWKTAVLKKAVKYAANLLKVKIGGKSLTSIVNYLTGFEGNIQKGMENGLVKYLHVNRTAAKWAAKTVMFIFF